MRIAILTANPTNTHGWGRHSRDLISALSACGVEIVLITSVDAVESPDLPIAAYHRILPSLTPAPRFSSLRLLASIPRVRRMDNPNLRSDSCRFRTVCPRRQSRCSDRTRHLSPAHGRQSRERMVIPSRLSRGGDYLREYVYRTAGESRSAGCADVPDS
jgi:hypothetical protein